MANYWYYNKDGKLYSSNEAKLWLAKDNCMHFGDLPQHVKDLNGLLPLTVKHEWVDLTDEEVDVVTIKCFGPNADLEFHRHYAHAVLAKSKEKNI
jgi:hypothetical protein